MAAITKVPNGPLIKKKGPFKGSTLKTGGAIKKAQNGFYTTKEGKNYNTTKRVNTKNGPRYYQGISPNMAFSMEIASDKSRKINDSIPKAKLSARALEVMNQKNGGSVKKAQGGVKATKDSTEYFRKKYLDKVGDAIFTTRTSAKKAIDNNMEQSLKDMKRQRLKGKPGYDANGFPKKKAGGMIKRADGSMSRRGLWDNIRANKGSGKKPTAAMLKQERKIKAKK